MIYPLSFTKLNNNVKNINKTHKTSPKLAPKLKMDTISFTSKSEDVKNAREIMARANSLKDKAQLIISKAEKIKAEIDQLKDFANNLEEEKSKEIRIITALISSACLNDFKDIKRDDGRTIIKFSKENDKMIMEELDGNKIKRRTEFDVAVSEYNNKKYASQIKIHCVYENYTPTGKNSFKAVSAFVGINKEGDQIVSEQNLCYIKGLNVEDSTNLNLKALRIKEGEIEEFYRFTPYSGCNLYVSGFKSSTKNDNISFKKLIEHKGKDYTYKKNYEANKDKKITDEQLTYNTLKNEIQYEKGFEKLGNRIRQTQQIYFIKDGKLISCTKGRKQYIQENEQHKSYDEECFSYANGNFVEYIEQDNQDCLATGQINEKRYTYDKSKNRVKIEQNSEYNLGHNEDNFTTLENGQIKIQEYLF